MTLLEFKDKYGLSKKDLMGCLHCSAESIRRMLLATGEQDYRPLSELQQWTIQEINTKLERWLAEDKERCATPLLLDVYERWRDTQI